LIVGPVGAGKSTLARELGKEHRAVLLILDDWMARLYGADERPAEGLMQWYVERRDRCIGQLWQLARQMLSVGTNVVLEIGLIRRDERQTFLERVDAFDCGLTMYVLDASRELRRERVERRNQEMGDTYAMQVPPHIFEIASDMWQEPEPDECIGRDIRFLPTAG
jgi:predicted kinase